MKDKINTWIGKSRYGYSIPYVINKELMKQHFHFEVNYFFDELFGIYIQEENQTNTFSFFLSEDSDGYWAIHYHMWLSDPEKEKNNTYNPIITNNENEIFFQTEEEAEEFLIKLLDKIVICIDRSAMTKLYKETLEEIIILNEKLKFYELTHTIFNKKKNK